MAFSIFRAYFLTPVVVRLCSSAIRCYSISYISFTALQTSIVKMYRVTVLAAVALNLLCFKSEITEQSNKTVLDLSQNAFMDHAVAF